MVLLDFFHDFLESSFFPNMFGISDFKHSGSQTKIMLRLIQRFLCFVFCRFSLRWCYVNIPFFCCWRFSPRSHPLKIGFKTKQSRNLKVGNLGILLYIQRFPGPRMPATNEGFFWISYIVKFNNCGRGGYVVGEHPNRHTSILSSHWRNFFTSLKFWFTVFVSRQWIVTWWGCSSLVGGWVYPRRRSTLVIHGKEVPSSLEISQSSNTLVNFIQWIFFCQKNGSSSRE